jgi:putative peptidoglycan lipid II flippase
MASTIIMAAGTMASRLLGMVRVVLAAWVLGQAGRQADMFAIAGQIPSQAYMLIAGGMLNSILLPQLMRAMTRDADGGQAYSDRIVTLFLLALISLTALLTVGAPLVIRLVVASNWLDPALAAQYGSMVFLATLCMPQIFFYGAFFLGGQLLNSRNSFGPLMWAPVLNNVIQIIMLTTYAVIWGFDTNSNGAFSNAQVLVLGIGSVVGVACQAALLLPYLKKVGFTYRPRFDFLHTGLGSTAHLAKWAIALTTVDQINFLVVTKVASVATVEGNGAGMSVFNTATLISFVPHALLTVSLATAMMPSLSTQANTSAWQEFTRQFVAGLRMVYAAMVPVCLLFATLGVSLVSLVMPGHGGIYTGRALVVLGLGLIPFSLRFLITKAFNAMGNTRTPFFIEVVFVVVTSGVSMLLVWVFGVPLTWVAVAIAAGYTLGYLVSAIVAWGWLRRVVPRLAKVRLAGLTAQLIYLAAPGAILAAAICWAQNWWWPGKLPQLLAVLIGLFLAVLIYWRLARAAGVDEVVQLEEIIRARLPHSGGGSAGGSSAPRRAVSPQNSTPSKAE